MQLNLTALEARILGALVEKELATPEYYPLTFNALVAACNQKNNRDPVLQLSAEDVERGLASLQYERKLVGTYAGAGARVVINAGAWTHYSYAIADAAALVEAYVEVHISNVHAREPFRAHSVLSAKAAGIIVGCGVGGYDLALAHLASSGTC